MYMIQRKSFSRHRYNEVVFLPSSNSSNAGMWTRADLPFDVGRNAAASILSRYPCRELLVSESFTSDLI